jgi:excisionase family DNA binding protein
VIATARTYASAVAGTVPASSGEDTMRSTQVAPMALKINEACSISRCGRTTVYEAIKRGELRALKRGKSTLILADDLRRWLESLPAIEVSADKQTNKHRARCEVSS